MKHYEDNFAHDHLPHPLLHAECFTGHSDFEFPEDLNCAAYLLDRHIAEGNGDKVAIRTFDMEWTYNDLYEKANQIAHVLKDDLGFVSGNRVLIRSANNPMYVACWFGILKAGGIVVATMPLLREKELTVMVESAEISHAFCDYRLADDMLAIQSPFLKEVVTFDGSGEGTSKLEALMADKPITFDNYPTKSDSLAIIGFTSGTTGKPKMTAHYHKDILLICEAFPKYSLQPTPDDIFTGSPPLGFTFGLGGLVLFPFYFGASTFLLEKPSPDLLLQAIQDYKITICFTAPTAWRVITTKVKDYDISSLRKCVSAGETLPEKIWDDWHEATGLKIIDGIGATEILHIFISSNESTMRKGATGVPIRGYEAKIIDNRGNEVPVGEPGRLAVRGITGCKYLASEEKQKEYVKNGWNITGDIFRKDEDGYFWFVARGDDMIISSGYNISAIEVENVLLMHNDIAECAVVGIPDEERGMLVCAYVVLKEKENAGDAMTKAIQDWFKEVAAPYKYPRKIHYLDVLPKTETGKIQRFKLKNTAQA
ncbi:AMP-binding protein [Flavobacterium salilacus subsp. salilacus]|uniref:AMP-binding protein n=1 Tax=Flavobacterium TaxID=237 RepID=UPI001074DEDD|nr:MULTISPECIES: AMP-binding protein [Flavobacterium]KAF2518612.1 AMP-binding protein [Flavobacterium salilacus subsp. salilacus]MBE1613569.1 AMP-binding protein [Flavobacterium sp. SaA2.13]